MKYNLDGFPQRDFEWTDALVKATVLASGRVGTWNTVRRVTSDPMDLAKAHRVKVSELLAAPEEIRGIAFTCQNNVNEFDLWINPGIVDSDNSNFRATVVHELCHGYRGTGKGHDPVWRRLYARSLFHYDAQVHTINHHSSLVDLSNWRYTKRGKTETTPQFLKRINADRDKWRAQAEDESEQVGTIWKRMISQY